MLRLLTELEQHQPDYVAALGTCADLLDAVINLLRDHAVWFCVAGVWREWADAQPEEALMEVSQEALEQSGDANVMLLLRLSQELAATRDALRASVL